MRTVGSRHAPEFESDPQRAWLRGRRLDALLQAAALPWQHGVIRATHAAMMQIDEHRMLDTARRINRR